MKFFFHLSELPAANHPERIIAVGQKVTIQCHSSNSNPADWWYQRNEDRLIEELCVNGEVVNGHEGRFWLNPNNYDLTLLSATWKDSGLYTCVEDTAFGTRHITHLTVTGNDA